MKILKYGTMTFLEGQGPQVDGWLVEREDTDPAEATTEQLILGFAIIWAKEKFAQAMNSAVMGMLRKNAIEKAAQKALAESN